MSAWTCRSIDGKAAERSFAPSSNPMMEGPWCDSEEKHEPASDIDTVVVDSLKALDPNGRLEKRTSCGNWHVSNVPITTKVQRTK